MKAKKYKDVKDFLDIPNVGPAMKEDFLALGLSSPKQLIHKDPLKLYNKMCQIAGTRKDPCVLDTYMAVIDFVNGSPAKPWFYYTKIRKKEYPHISKKSLG